MARGLFPFPLAAYQIAGAPKQEPPKQGGTQQVGSRRGFMGAFQRKSLPRTLQVIGATLRDIGNPNSQALDQFAADEMRQRAIAMAERAQERTAQQEKTQQGAMEEAIASLPPQQQAWARLNPEAFARAYIESLMGGNQWETDGTQPYRVGPNGEVILGSGTIPHRPRAPLIQYGSPMDDDLEPYNGP